MYNVQAKNESNLTCTATNQSIEDTLINMNLSQVTIQKVLSIALCFFYVYINLEIAYQDLYQL